MKHFPIKAFTGIDTKTEETDQDRGTLRRAMGVMVAPAGCVSSMPTWGYAYGVTNLGAQIATALAGADNSKVHFVTVTDSNGAIFLVAWDLAAGMCCGCWQVNNIRLSFDQALTLTISAPVGSPYRDKAAGQTWFGTFIGSALFLGNGSDVNMVWRSGSLSLLGPASPPVDPADPARDRIPPCTSFTQTNRGEVVAAGNPTYPMRVWITEPPTAKYPTVDGVQDVNRSFTDLRSSDTKGDSIVAISTSPDGRILAHVNNGGAVILGPQDSSDDGGIMPQHPLAVTAGAMNPRCVHDTKESSFYLGRDREIYVVELLRQGANRIFARDRMLATKRSSGDWNRDMVLNNLVASLIYDERNDRLWIWAALALGRIGVWCFDRKSFAVTGPFLSPDLVAVTQPFHQNDGASSALEAPPVFGFTRDGALMFANLSLTADHSSLPNYSDPIGANYSELSVAPTPSPGLPYVGVSADGQSFKHVLNGVTLNMASPWADLAAGDITTTRFFKNAHLAMIELADEDFGEPSQEKDFCGIRLNWRQGSRVYFGVYAQSAGISDGQWYGTAYPGEEAIVPIQLKGRRLKIRVVMVFFNDYPAMLPDMTVDYLLVPIA